MQRAAAAAPNSALSSDAQLFLQMIELDERVSEADMVDIEAALRAHPDYIPALMAKAALLASRGESAGAIAIYTEVLARFPDSALAQKRAASLYQKIPERRGEAYDLAVKARKALPDDPELGQILAKLSYEREEYAYAVQLLKQSAEQEPLDAEHLYYLGMSQLKSKHLAQARQALDQALAAGLHDPLASDARQAIRGLDQRE